MRLRNRKSRVPDSFEAFGVPLALTVDGAGLEAHVETILPPGWRPRRSARSAPRFEIRRVGRDIYEVRLGGHVWVGQAPLDMALGVLDAQMRLHIAANARDWTFVHAGAVAHRGKALLIPGESFSGKSTLVKALVEAGAIYYSDEYAVLDDDGRVHPYPRRLSLRRHLTTDERHVSELGGVAGDQEAEVALVALTRYRPGGQWQPRRLSSGQGMTALLSNTVPAQERPRQSMSALGKAIRGAAILEGERGEATVAAAALMEELAALAGD